MQEHHHLPRGLLYRRIVYFILESQPLHSLEEDRCFVTTRVGEDRLAAGREELRDQVGQSRDVLALVEYVRRENEVESSQASHFWLAPVEESRAGFLTKVRTGVVGREVEGCLVVVRREDFCAAGEGGDGWKSHTAPEFDGSGTRNVEGREVTGQDEGARPEFGPVR
jgi:hypothetical protein